MLVTGYLFLQHNLTPVFSFTLCSATGEALWEPSALGYTKSDGFLVLANGEICEDPLLRRAEVEPAQSDDENEEVAKVVPEKKKKNNKLCSECADRTATRGCNECGDKYCTKCYKFMHSTGTRRTHTFTALGPVDCTECELKLAERWCVRSDTALSLKVIIFPSFSCHLGLLLLLHFYFFTSLIQLIFVAPQLR